MIIFITLGELTVNQGKKMNKLWFLILVPLVLTGCGKSKEQQRYDAIEKRQAEIKVEMEPHNKECKFLTAENLKKLEPIDSLEKVTIIEKAQLNCLEAQDLAKESMKLALEQASLIPFLKK